MTGKELTARQKYIVAYRRFRQYGDDWDYLYLYDTSTSIVQAAEYAYEAATYSCSGWLNRRRHTQFLNKRALFMHNREWPF